MLFTQLKQLSQRALLPVLLICFIAGSEAYAADIRTSNSQLFKHDNSSGGKATDTVLLKAPSVPAGSCAVFVKASVVYKKQRFGEANILSKPAKGCNPARQQCRASVSVKYAPVGRLHYQVQADWEVKSTGC